MIGTMTKATGNMNRVSTIEPYRMGKGIRAFSTLRGCTNPSNPYDGFNACHYTGDDRVHVEACRRELSRVVGGMPLVIPHQTHSLNVMTVDSATDAFPENVDALVTSLPGVALVVHTADCVPVFLADAEAGVVGIAHSGWKGTLGRIAALTVEAMAREGASPKSIRAAIGPSICCESYEVGPELAVKFHDAGLGAFVASEYTRPHIDLAAAVAFTLIGAGLSRENILLSGECTLCNPERRFSARALGVASGRISSVIARV